MKTSAIDAVLSSGHSPTFLDEDLLAECFASFGRDTESLREPAQESAEPSTEYWFM